MDFEISKRIEKARLYGNLSQDALGKKIGKNRKTIMNYESASSEPTASLVQKIAHETKVNEWWLFSGKGDMLDENNNIATKDEGYKIDVLNVKASAGKGIENHVIEVIDTIILDKTFFKTKPEVNKIKIIQVSGDSMYPTLSDGDYVIVDESKSHGIDGIYAIQLHSQILIKRLKFRLDGTIEIISDNKDYQSEIYDPKNSQIPFHIIGMKTLSIQR